MCRHVRRHVSSEFLSLVDSSDLHQNALLTFVEAYVAQSSLCFLVHGLRECLHEHAHMSVITENAQVFVDRFVDMFCRHVFY